MKLATGIDLLIWGWVFFGMVMLIIFSIGAIWREPEAVAPAPAAPAAIAAHGRGVALGATAIVIAMLLLHASSNHIAAHQSEVRAPTQLPAVIGEWVLVDRRPWTWSPHFLPAELGAALTYRRGDLTLTVDVAHFVQQRQDAEVINSQNLVVGGKDPAWRVVGQGSAPLDTAYGPLDAETFRVRGPQSLAVWRWYRIGSRYTANPYVAKLYQAIDRLTLDRTDGAIVHVAAPLDAQDRPHEAEVKAFVDLLLPVLSEALDRSVGE